MEAQIRRHRSVRLQDQENVHANKGKANILMPFKKQGLTVRGGALGDLNTNVQAQRDVNVGKVAVAAAEFEKKATLSRGAAKINYSHVQPRVDTGITGKSVIQPSSRPPLRREESTAGHAVRALAHSRIALKEQTNESTDTKASGNINAQLKKPEPKKSSKLPTVNENREIKTTKPLVYIKPRLKEPTESLGKLKIDDRTSSLINTFNLQNHASLLPVVSETMSELPDNIEDIDADDCNSPLLMSTYIKDIYKYLTELEEKYPIEPDYLKKQSVITGKMRATLIDWLVDVHRQFSLELETFHLTVGIIDRYLQAVPNIQRSKLQLVGITAMFIASKFEEIYAPAVDDFVYVTDKAYSKADVFQCERDILSKLGFCLARPIPLSFLRRFVKAAQGTSKNHHLAKYFVDLSLIEYSMVHYRPSELSAAAVCLSLFLFSGKTLADVWSPTLCYYSGYTLHHIKPIITQLAKIVTHVESSKYKAVYNKYQDISLAKVSSLPLLQSEALFKLAKLP